MYHQVRNIVGCLLEIGLRRGPPERVERLLAGEAWPLLMATAPPEALLLKRVIYEGPFAENL